MIEGSSDRNSSGRPAWGTWLYSKGESVWYVLVFVIPFLTIRILIASSEAASKVESTGQFTYPGGYIGVAVFALLLCACVPFLLKNSEFKWSGIALTSAIPATAIIWGWIAMESFVENELAFRTSDPVGHYFVTRRAYNVYKNRYLAAEGHKAIAQADSGAWAWTAEQPTAMKAAEVALVRCMDTNEKDEAAQPCDVTVLDDQWIEPAGGYNQ